MFHFCSLRTIDFLCLGVVNFDYFLPCRHNIRLVSMCFSSRNVIKYLHGLCVLKDSLQRRNDEMSEKQNATTLFQKKASPKRSTTKVTFSHLYMVPTMNVPQHRTAIFPHTESVMNAIYLSGFRGDVSWCRFGLDHGRYSVVPKLRNMIECLSWEFEKAESQQWAHHSPSPWSTTISNQQCINYLHFEACDWNLNHWIKDALRDSINKNAFNLAMLRAFHNVHNLSRNVEEPLLVLPCSEFVSEKTLETCKTIHVTCGSVLMVRT